MHAGLDDCRGSLLPAAVTLPALREGGVGACLGTIFTQAIDPETERGELTSYMYPFGDADAAFRAGMRQLKLYRAWHEAGIIELLPRRGRVRDAPPGQGFAPLRLGVLMECADPIGSPDELDEWAEGGVIAIGLAWWHQGRYAGGNGSDNAGLTDLGRALVARMDGLNLVHDASHLSQRSLDELLTQTDRPVIASHSNCRALLPGENHRHLSDDSIREIGRRGGVVGINLVSGFLDPTLASSGAPQAGRATIDQVCAHVEHVCGVVGDRAHVGLGSDMDGGFTALGLPEGIDEPKHLDRLAEALTARDWSDEDVAGFAWGNWARFWGVD